MKSAPPSRTSAASGMKRLVLDLRDNPGGALDQAIAISNRFLPRGDMIVYTRGRSPNSDQDYRATEQSDYTHLPIVVMVNRNSASASEIVSGALQDHDRALVVGETTFGKALVQSVYRISENAGLALTTGRYYTPSGRLIQRPWDGTFDEYLTYTLRDQKAERQHSSADLKYTDAGRKVYSGGGIEPDKFMAGPVEGFAPTKFGRQIWGSGQFQRFADQYMAEGDTRLTAANKNKKRISQGVHGHRRDAAGFPRAARRRRRSPIDEEAFKTDLNFIKALDPLRDRSGAVWRRRSPAEPDSPGSAGEVRARASSAKRSASPSWRATRHGVAAGRSVRHSNRAFGRYILGRSLSLPLGIGAC